MMEFFARVTILLSFHGVMARRLNPSMSSSAFINTPSRSHVNQILRSPETTRTQTKMLLYDPENMFAALSLLTSSTSVPTANLLGSVAQEAAAPFGLVSAGYALLSGESGEAEGENSAAAADGEVDLYRDTPVRYCGYANEVGEAFAPLVPAWIVPASYAVAIAYVCADTVDKGVKAFKGGRYMESSIGVCTVIESLDAFIWQIAASVALPGYTIHQIVAATVLVSNNYGWDADPVLKVLPTAIGLATIPFIVKPLDEFAEKGMDWTLRKLWSPFLESCEVSYPDFDDE